LPLVTDETIVNDKLVEKVRGDTDGLLPFRTMSEGWKRMSDGPLSPEHVKTTAGLFSLMVWRGITFRTKFSLDVRQPVLFKDAKAFLDVIERLKCEKSAYYCRQDAYGPSRGRTADNAEFYWRKASDAQWNAWVIKETPGKFEVLQKEFKTHLPGFGNLTAYLLAADYAEVGIIEMPSAYTVGKQIARINAGATKGLKKFGAVFADGDKDALAHAFAKAYENVQDMLSENEMKAMRYNPLMLEHAFCKYSKLDCRTYEAFW
jgi:hypothetical protein